MRSSNEISGLLLKAARGAGLPLGTAEDLARAGPHLAATGHLDLIPAVLAQKPQPPQLSAGKLTGGHPLLVISSWLDLSEAGAAPGGDMPVDPISSALRLARSQPAPVGPFEVLDEVWEELTRYAQMTFVPESDASRLGGAGAGLTDND